MYYGNDPRTPQELEDEIIRLATQLRRVQGDVGRRAIVVEHVKDELLSGTAYDRTDKCVS